MKVGSLFSGIGGLDLGLERAGMSVVWQCEADAYCRAVLRAHWPDVPCYEDVRGITADAPAVDLLCGGFPCQPVSKAGKRKAQDDDRWLWPEFARLIRDLRPRYALMENVPGLLTAAGGDAMGEVLGDLASIGFDAEWESIPASAVGAPHLRDRVFILAYPNAHGVGLEQGREAPEILHPREPEPGREPGELRREMAYAVSQPVRDATGSVDGPQGARESEASQRERLRAHAVDGGPGADVPVPNGSRSSHRGEGSPGSGEPRARTGADPAPRDRARAELGAGRGSLGDWWATEPDVGRVAHGVPARVDRLRALGNAVVPQVAEWIGRQIMNAAYPPQSCNQENGE